MVFDREDKQIIDNTLTPAGNFDFNALLCYVSGIAISISPKILSLILTPIKGILDEYSTRKRVEEMKHVLQIFVNAIRHLDDTKLNIEYIESTDYQMQVKKILRIVKEEEREQKLSQITSFLNYQLQCNLQTFEIIDTLIALLDQIHPQILAILTSMIIEADKKIPRPRLRHLVINQSYKKAGLVKLWHDAGLIDPNLNDGSRIIDNVSYLLCILESNGLIEVISASSIGGAIDKKYRITLLAFTLVQFLTNRNDLLD